MFVGARSLFMVDRHAKPTIFRRRAIELREKAHVARSPDVKVEMLQMADEWESLARFLEKKESSQG